MPRHKVNVPVFENPAIKESKKKKKIFYVVSWIYGLLLLSGSVFTGLKHDNALIYGWGHIIMGIMTIFMIAFVLYTDIKGWYRKYIYWKEKEILLNCGIYSEDAVNIESIKNDLENNRVATVIFYIMAIGITIYMFIFGIRALFGIR